MPAEQETDQIGLLPDRLGRDAEDMTKHERLGLRVAKRPVRPLARLGGVEVVEVAAVQRIDDRVAQGREEFAQRKRQLTTGLQQVVRQGAQVRRWGPEHHHQVGRLALVPAQPEPRLVGEAEGDVVVEGDQLETARVEPLQNAFFKQEPIGVGDQREPRDLAGKLPEDRIAPARPSHRGLPPHGPAVTGPTPGWSLSGGRVAPARPALRRRAATVGGREPPADRSVRRRGDER